MPKVNVANQKRTKMIYQLIINYNIIFCFLIVICRIFLGRILDDTGIGYLALPMELYLIAVYMFSMPFAKSISGMIKQHIKRGQYKTAMEIVKSGFVLLLVPAVLLGILYIISCRNLATSFRSDLSWMALGITSVSVFFSTICGAPKGFLMGVSSRIIVLIGQIVETILSITGLIVGAKAGMKYGGKVAALLKNENMVYGYGAFGAMAGLALGCIVAWVLWMILYFIFRSAFSAKMMEDVGRIAEDMRSCFRKLLNNVASSTVTGVLTQGIVLLLLWIYMHHPGTEDAIGKTLAYWGCFYGKYLPVMMIPMALCSYQMALHNSRIKVAYENDDSRQLRDRVERGIIKLNAISVSGAVFVAILGQAFAGALFTGMTTSVLKLITTTSVLVVCYCYFYATHNLLQKINHDGESIMILAVMLPISAIISYVSLVKMHKGLTGVAVSMIIYYLIGAVAAGVRIYLLMRCKLNLIRCFAFPVLAAAISGIIVVFLNRMLFELAGAVITLIVGVFVGIIVDIILLMAFHVITENQVRNIPGGFILVQFGKAIGLL